MADEEPSLEEIVKKGPDAIIEHYRGQAGKGFDDRVKKFKEFHNPENQIPNIIGQKAEDAVIGAQGHDKGAYHAAIETLYKHATHDHFVVDNLDNLIEIAESYVDAFLSTYLGHDRWHEIQHDIEHAGLSKEDARKFKGNLFSQYTPPGRNGRRVNPLDTEFLKNNFLGKKRTEIRTALKEISDITQENFTGYLLGKARRNLITEDDYVELAKHVGHETEHQGYEHTNHPMTHDYDQLLSTLTNMALGQDLRNNGYRKKAGEAAAHH